MQLACLLATDQQQVGDAPDCGDRRVPEMSSVGDNFSLLSFPTEKINVSPIKPDGADCWFSKCVKSTESTAQQATALTRHFKTHASHLRIDTLQRLIDVLSSGQLRR